MQQRRAERGRRPGAWWLLAVATSACVGDLGPEDDAAPVETATALCGADKPFVRRLTVDEYTATIEATLGVDVHDEAVAALPADLRADGFSNTANALIVGLEHVEAYAALAEAVASALDAADLAATHGGCSDFGAACERAVVTGLATRLFRHPPDEAEVAALLPLFDAAEAEGEGFEVAVSLVVEALLQSPRFLYRLEAERGAGRVALDGYEVASRLSYFLWGAPPDDALLAVASQLHSEEAIAAQVDRMLDDPRARRQAERFVIDWLDLGRLDNLQRDPASYPDWEPVLGEAMKAETVRFFTHLALDEERPLADLYDAELTFVTPELAAHYGLPVPEDSDQPLRLDEVPSRGGLLTQGSIAAIGGNTSSMVARGLFVLENVLCGHLSEPPPGVDTTPPEISADTPQRTVSEQRVDDPACGGCHIQIEPVAWGIERFDAVGRYVLEDAFGNPLAQHGSVVLENGSVEFDDVAGLGALLAGSSRAQACLARKTTQYALGRPIEPGKHPTDRCTDDEITERFAASEGTYRDLVLAVTLSTSFRHLEGQP